MRFPIHYKKFGSGSRETREYTNLSTALIETLMDRGIISPETGLSSQDYFDLPINEGFLLSFLHQLYELEGKFHVGCSYDRRPPSFSFYIQVGEKKLDGEWNIGYRRELEFGVFEREKFFHKPETSNPTQTRKVIRDLDALAEAYNSPGNYREYVAVSWTGARGNKTHSSGFVHAQIWTGFREGRLIELDLVPLLPKTRVVESSSPPETDPLLSAARDLPLPLTDIAAAYYSKSREMPLRHPADEILTAIGYSPAQVLQGMLQVAERAMPFRKGITLDLGLCKKVFNN